MRTGWTALAMVMVATGCTAVHKGEVRSVAGSADGGSASTPIAGTSGPTTAAEAAREATARADASVVEHLVPPPHAPGLVSEGVRAEGTGFGGGGARAKAARDAMPMAVEPKHRHSAGAVLARPEGSVRAGEWDDNANYREFRKYLASEASLPIEKLDLSHRRFLVVRDANGKGVINCPVRVRDVRQAETVLTTTASGRALLFPRAEGLSGNELQVTAECLGRAARQTIEVSADDGVVELRLDAVRPTPSRSIDLVFVLDTTGSMSEEIDAVKDTIRKVALEAGGQRAIRVALVEYRDKGDGFVTRVHPFSTDIAGFAARIASIQAGGGGDTPEHANEGLRVAVESLDWNPGASARLAFLIGDAPPHLDYQDDPGYGRSLKRAAARGIQLYTVAASGMDAVGQVVWRQTAQYTGATNLFVLRGGAGPQSTGAGDPKSSCGGTQTNYTSGNLDQLIGAKIALTETLLDLDPMRIAGLGQDEKAKPCDRRLVLAR